MVADFTPGPWTIDDGDISETVRAPDGLDIAFVTPRACPGDARLIAAAPDLLAFVREAAKLSSYAEFANWRQMTADARALIAKATGEPQS